MMTLRKRLANQIALMCGGVLLLGIAAVAGVRGLRQDFSVALRANQALRDIYTVGLHVGNAREELADTPPDVDGSSRELHVAIVDFEESRLADDVLRGALLDALKNPADARRIDRTYTALVDFSANIREQITQRQSAADRKFHLILATVALLATAVMCTAIFIGVKQYRSVMRPLGEIQSAVRRFASGEFTQRVVAGGDAEFVSLASDFNRMADELAALYGELENRVQTKSRQLVQSERLASLGYLAAGVAHEINNPLGIISGYAERSLQRIDVGWSDDTANYVRKTISIMCDEAFRCKAITDRLLMLARPGEQTRKNISLLKLTQEVVSSLGGLQRFADRRITIQTQSDSMVFASEGELKQVIMNLLVNALEASPAGSGQVHVTIAGGEHFVELSVADNGRGMNDQTRQQVFEPFFTQKRSDRPGTGLGLSVAHAIVSDHGGAIEAHSEGLGMGSVFVVRLPLSQEKVEVHDASAC